jgi:hypothetical protein
VVTVTLSKVAVDNSELFRLLTTNPMYPLLAIDMLTVLCSVQFTPSSESTR